MLVEGTQTRLCGEAVPECPAVVQWMLWSPKTCSELGHQRAMQMFCPDFKGAVTASILKNSLCFIKTLLVLVKVCAHIFTKTTVLYTHADRFDWLIHNQSADSGSGLLLLPDTCFNI